MSKRNWTPQEDTALKTFKQELGSKKWAVIARKLNETAPGLSKRTGKQCRQRYHNKLASNITKNEWNLGDDTLFLSLYEIMGNKWSAIARGMPGKSDNGVKNHFNSRIRKSIRKINKVITIPKITNAVLKHIVGCADCQKLPSKINIEQIQDLCRNLRKRLFLLSADEDDSEETKKQMVDLIEVIKRFKEMDKRLLQSPTTLEKLSPSEGKDEVRENKISPEEIQFSSSNQSKVQEMKIIDYLLEVDCKIEEQDFGFFWETEYSVVDTGLSDQSILNRQLLAQSDDPVVPRGLERELNYMDNDQSDDLWRSFNPN